ncbi:Methyltransferase domain-containing protein [Streptoalloteichus tenebrarius]|uniref:Methyltransferase domain-containing protein n=1 Tax=Streptoalloteichus tenebrarius (strain ATCC 17920 / DSM 40477 / JCM 4838 / CBS 697.72 / NBRC 16177 / NCIMB 11028 / NRRL B-12390 / A12253. 1 / ISP 5477) TaxID=1933 RepID=A0ABT1HLY8_STRSD|nr:class I SAM-dependent methyltransferase [Streptoalloteichus tenebrarius]MCP2256522.1 Methyltransferase domain-containing protein [Streptoalloteichus tenebrarius]BFF04873.1 hypothetical protein GCM10020241_65480 [Streptoalloteichus tenebrarius]
MTRPDEERQTLGTADAYREWAPFYDADYAHVRFDRVARAFHDLAVRHGSAEHDGQEGQGRCRLVDLGCGTGASALAFASLGYRVTGCDLSPAMLDVARGKPGADRITFVEADLRALPDLGRFDVATAMTDPLSHLLTDDEFAAALAGVARSLVPGGVLVFDQRNEHAYRRLSGRTLVARSRDQLMTWDVLEQSTSDGVAVFGMRITRHLWAGEGERQRQITHQHFLRHRGESLIRRLLRDAGLPCVAVHGLSDHGHLNDRPHAEDQQTTLYVARKPLS